MKLNSFLGIRQAEPVLFQNNFYSEELIKQISLNVYKDFTHKTLINSHILRDLKDREFWTKELLVLLLKVIEMAQV